MNRLMALRLACILSAAGLFATLAGCASKAGSTTAQADKPVQQTATTSSTSSATGVSPQSSGSGAASPATRDWAQVDTNRDGSISPEEMATYLQNNPGPLKGR
ncbi:EF-hand domain-containing protein [Azohydromonas caseinilytica]|uniref:EF-hand domain-containing protein n=1 Tax=Azohydromonas caseinilytica TaxID=2728836 RepID=A0A848FC46_9BURK|nr:EF-hand domain-containing protein [Azohydromonas caseinilytica]NML15883.1 hypothetical protein [Azohydromonas caseinilytica]